ncbi:hypothetical protein ACJ73_09017 [Blastomyces percursus]|uniref:DDE Tnp4 domain-containing protein n=1 Tax=Blastomyces percursus TaxID=1658174 RepID=A0A1J9QGI8_9EURO|nr:hypothetical protein ACJ73_09017 [Blastomyces percursus]
MLEWNVLLMIAVFLLRQSNDNFTATSGCYFLADAGYSKRTKVFWFHIRANQQTSCHKQELFNLRHAGMRSVIERGFGIFKRRFRIYDRARERYSIGTQVHLVFTLAAVHNFLNKHKEFGHELTVDSLENEQEEDIYIEQSEEQEDESYMIRSEMRSRSRCGRPISIIEI